MALSSFSGNSQKVTLQDIAKKGSPRGYGIVGQEAPELNVKQWVDANGKESEGLKLSDHEGKRANTYERMAEIQKEYDLQIPFGHDLGENTPRGISTTMTNYRTGGTPWFIFIDESGKVVFNDYHLNTENAIEYLKAL